MCSYIKGKARRQVQTRHLQKRLRGADDRGGVAGYTSSVFKGQQNGPFHTPGLRVEVSNFVEVSSF